MPKSELAAVLLALAAAFASAIGNVARQRSAHEVTDGRVGYLALFFMSWRNRDWRLGAVAAVANYGLQAGALSLGSVILVTGLQVTALLFALPLYARMSGAPVSRWDWSWAAILATALAVVVTVGNPVAGYSRAPLHTWLVVGAIAGPLVGLCLLGARLWPDGVIAAVLLAAVSGASLALFAVLVKGAVDVAKGRHRGGPGHSRALCLHRRCDSRDGVPAVGVSGWSAQCLDADDDGGQADGRRAAGCLCARRNGEFGRRDGVRSRPSRSR